MGAPFIINATGSVTTVQPYTSLPGFGENGPGSYGQGASIGGDTGTGAVATSSAAPSGGTGGSGGGAAETTEGVLTGTDEGYGAPYPDNRRVSVSISFKAS